jgi:Bacterial pre-peptidase C-terminal domain
LASKILGDGFPMSRLTRPTRHRIGQLRPRFELLESRHLLSLTGVLTDPVPNTRLPVAPTALTVTFDLPIDPNSLCNNDIQLDRVANDNKGLTPLVLNNATEAPGPNANQLEFTPGQDLTPGHYRIILAGCSPIMDSTDQVGIDGIAQILGDFWVVPKVEGKGLGDAFPLGTPGPTPTSTSGTLDFQANPNDVKLYKITLPAGHFWSLGLEVTAERDAGPLPSARALALDSALALFDAQGKLIATDSLGPTDDPKDPYLYAGLNAGTYYIGVSGAGDIPGTPTGYDPATATPGSVLLPPVGGGPFTLHLVAVPADHPITLLNFNVDRADPLDPNPTGLTLQFSGTLLNPVTTSPQQATNLDKTIEVVDSTGHAYPVVFTGYSEPDARISFVFDDPLPPGHYTIRLPNQGGLVDLAGHSPVAPGQPAGVLGTFTVEPSKDPHDLGVLLPNAASTFDAQLSPGNSVTYRFVIASSANIQLETRYSGGSLAINLVDPDGSTHPIDPGQPDEDVKNLIFLTPGVYHLQLTANGSQPVHVHGVLTAIPPDSLQYYGFGTSAPVFPLPYCFSGKPQQPQSPALPTVPTSAPAPPVPSRLPTLPLFPTSPTTTASQQLPPGSFLGLGGTLVGRPSLEANQPATVGQGPNSEVITFAQGVLIPLEIGSESRLRGSSSSDGSSLLKVDVVLAAPAGGALGAESERDHLAYEGSLHLAKRWLRLGRLDAAIARWLEIEVDHRLRTESGDEDFLTRAEGARDEAGPDPVAAEQASLTSDPDFGFALTLIILSIYYYYWLNHTDRTPSRSSPREGWA